MMVLIPRAKLMRSVSFSCQVVHTSTCLGVEIRQFTSSSQYQVEKHVDAADTSTFSLMILMMAMMMPVMILGWLRVRSNDGHSNVNPKTAITLICLCPIPKSHSHNLQQKQDFKLTHAIVQVS